MAHFAPLSFLQAVWLFSLLLAAISVLGMLLLVVRRVLLNWRDARLVRRRGELSERLLYWLASESDLPPHVARRDQDILVDLVFELLRLVRGDSEAKLRTLLNDSGALDRELAQLERGGRAARLKAARRLAYFNDGRIAPLLRRTMAHDKRKDVRLAAASSLVEMNAIKDLAQFVRELGVGTEEHSRILYFLFRKFGPGYVGQLVDLLQADVPDMAKALALDALGRSGAYEAIPVIAGYLDNPSLDIRSQALRALADLGHPLAADAVRRGLQDKAWPVRAAAAQAAGRIGLQESSESLKSLLDDDQWWVRHRAAEALFVLGGAARRFLEEASGQPTRAGRVAQMILWEKAAQ